MAGNKGIVSAQFYTFSAANRTITFTNDYAGLDLGEITYITNIKNGVATVIYDPFDATKGSTLSGLTLTLAYDTTLMADTDPLQIITGFTPLNADPTPVRIVEGPDQIDDTVLLQNISDNLDFLNLALDQNEGIQINTRDVNPAKRDINNAQIISDSVDIFPPKLLKSVGDSLTVDTTGYNTTLFTYRTGPGVASFNVVFETSNDGSTWIPAQAFTGFDGGSYTYLTAGAQNSISSNFTFTAIVYSIGKFTRIRLSQVSSGTATVTAQLRNLVSIPPAAIGLINTINISQINGTSPVAAAGLNSTNGLQSVAGTLQVSGQLSPTQNPPNAVQTLQTTVPNPMGIGGREQPYIGVLAGVFRYLNVDGRGYLQIGGDTAFRTPNMGGVLEQSSAGTTRGIGGVLNNIQGAQSLTVADTNQNEGDTDNMLLAQILKELKILNQNFAELPQILNQANYPISDPQEYRNDTNFQ